MVREAVGNAMLALPKDLKRSYYKLGPVIAIVDWIFKEVRFRGIECVSREMKRWTSN